MIISVTRKHIKNGTPQCPCTCPIAHALKDAGFESALVGTMKLYGTKNNKDFVVDSPKSVISFITKFDLDQPVKPFKFRLTV